MVMARPTKEPAKMMQKFATRIRAELDSLVEEYDARLADRPGYDLIGIFVGPVVLAVAHTLLEAWAAEADEKPAPLEESA